MNKHDQYFRNKLNDYLQMLKTYLLIACIFTILGGTFYIGRSSKEFFCTPDTVCIDTLSSFYESRRLADSVFLKHAFEIEKHNFIHHFPK